MVDESRLRFTIKLAKDVGNLLLEYFQHANKKISFKNDRSVVTEADLAADRYISAALQKQFPGERILSEELAPFLEAGRSESIEGSAWIVDPLDGTTNFSLGLPFWGTLLTWTQSGMPDLTVMYFPALDELYSAMDGQGGYLNQKTIHTVQPHPGATPTFFACCSRAYRNYEIKVPYKTRILGSAAYTFCLVGRGSALIGFEATPKIWDIAGPWLLMKEAGGIIETYSGEEPFPIRTNVHYENESYPTLASATAELMIKARNWIRPKTT